MSASPSPACTSEPCLPVTAYAIVGVCLSALCGVTIVLLVYIRRQRLREGEAIGVDVVAVEKPSKRTSYIDHCTSVSPSHEECSICMASAPYGTEAEGSSEWSRLPCGHEYHRQCIGKWFQRSSRCPICRYDLQATIPTSAPTAPDDLVEPGASPVETSSDSINIVVTEFTDPEDVV
eukprot:Sspe_Gene.78213::Locus_48921_Transcript_1_1_Confidence_1.000_Length_633::g.78213::m.78213